MRQSYVMKTRRLAYR